MNSSKDLRRHLAAVPGPGADIARSLAARLLRGASAVLARWALSVARPAASIASADPRLEFYLEASAPEGALYLDGELVGHIEGVRRL